LLDESEKQLLVALKKEDPMAQYEVFNKYSPMLLSYLCRSLNRLDAEEVLMDVFQEFFNQINKYDGRISIKSWLYQLTNWRLKDFLRKIQTQIETVELHELLLGERLTTNDIYFLEEQEIEQDCTEHKKIMFKLLNELNEKERFILDLYAEGFTSTDIAKLFNLKPNTIRVKISRLKERLTRRLEEELKKL